jgi:hypothetical protein
MRVAGTLMGAFPANDRRTLFLAVLCDQLANDRPTTVSTGRTLPGVCGIKEQVETLPAPQSRLG